MKILDRYVGVSFVKNYLISFMILVGMYVVLDMVFNFDEIADVQKNAAGQATITVFQALWHVVDFYFYQSFLIFVHMSGIIPVVAAAFTLMRMSRFNELAAYLAAGVPLERIARPIVIIAVILNGLLLFDQEYVLPRMVDKILRTHDDIHHDSTTKAVPIRGVQDDQDALFNAVAYYAPLGSQLAHIKYLDVIYRDENMQIKQHLSADEAKWDPAKYEWKLTNGKLVKGLLPDQEKQPAEIVEVYKSNITPEELALHISSKSVELLSTERINQLLAPERHKSYGEKNLLVVKHTRFAQPIMNIIILLLAIPAVLTREPGQLRAAATKCLVFTGLAMASIFVARQIAGNPPADFNANYWSATWAWVPIFIFLPLSLILLDRMHNRGS